MTRSGLRVRPDSHEAYAAAQAQVTRRLVAYGCAEPYPLAEQIMRDLVGDGWRATGAYVDDRAEDGPAGDPATNRAYVEARARARAARDAEAVQS